MAIMEQRHFGFEIRVDEEAGRFAARVLFIEAVWVRVVAGRDDVTDALQRQAHVDMNTAANGPRRAAKKVERKTSKKTSKK